MIITEHAGNPKGKSPQFSSQQLKKFRDFYVENGVVLIPGLLTHDWADALMRVIADVRRRAAAGEPLGEAELHQFPGKATTRWLWREYDTVKSFFTEAGVQNTVAAVIGTTRLQYWFDNTFIHEYGKDAQGSQWHHDIAAFPFGGEQIPSVWIAMTDIPLNMAPLQIIKGSHRNQTQFRPPVYIDPNAVRPEGYEEMPDVDAKIISGEFEVLQWPVKKGDCLMVHPNAIHGSPPTEIEGVTRVAFTTRWAGDDVVWKPDAFSMEISGLDYSKVAFGERPSGDRFPYATLS